MPRRLLAVLLVSLVWRVPSLFDPPWVNDEGTYFAVAQAMSHGYRLYAGVWENKPPAIYLVYDAVYHLLGPSLLAVRLLAAAAAMCLVTLVALIAGRYCAGRTPLAAAMLAGLLLGVPFLEGTTANAEIFLAAFAALAVYLAVVKDRAALAGVAASGAILFKAVGALDVAAIAVWLVIRRPRSIVPYAATIVACLDLTALVSWRAGILTAALRDAVIYNVGYVGHGNGGGFPWLLALKLAALMAATVWLRSRPFPLLWLLYAAIGALFSGRIFGHYFIQAIAPLSICAGLWLDRHPDLARRSVTLLPALFLSCGLLAAGLGFALATDGHDDIFAQRLQYYSNFARFALGTESATMYRSQVDDHVNRNLRIVRALNSLPPERLLIWGNIPWVYVLSHRLPATPYTSAVRDPRVPGETRALRRAVAHGKILVVVVRPPLPSLGKAGALLRRRYRVARHVGNAVIYVSRALSPARVAK